MDQAFSSARTSQAKALCNALLLAFDQIARGGVETESAYALVSVGKVKFSGPCIRSRVEMRAACWRKPKPRSAEASALNGDQEPEPSATAQDFAEARASVRLIAERLLAEHKAKSPSGRRKASRPA